MAIESIGATAVSAASAQPVSQDQTAQSVARSRQADQDRAAEEARRREQVQREQQARPPVVNAQGQTTGTVINTTA